MIGLGTRPRPKYGGFGAQSIGAPIGALIGAPVGAPIGALIDMHIHIENLCIYRLYMYYICMYRGIDVSQVKYARIENVCIYLRVDSTGSTIYVCIVE